MLCSKQLCNTLHAAGTSCRCTILPPTGACSCGHADCKSPGKHPRIPKGLKKATTSRAQVETWWARWPDANIGISTGPSGLDVFDLDGPEGQADLKKLVEQHGALPRTLVARTGRQGGLHLYFQGAISRQVRKPRMSMCVALAATSLRHPQTITRATAMPGSMPRRRSRPRLIGCRNGRARPVPTVRGAQRKDIRPAGRQAIISV